MMTNSVRCLDRSVGESNTGMFRKVQDPGPGQKDGPGEPLR